MEPESPDAQEPEAPVSPGVGTETPADEEPEDFSEEWLEARVQARLEERLQREQAERQTREVEERKKNQDKAYREGVAQAFQRRAPALRDVLTKAATGEFSLTDRMPNSQATYIDGILNLFSNHHAESSEVERWAMTEAIRDLTANLLPEDERPKFLEAHEDTEDFEVFMSDWKERVVADARKGYYTEAQKKDAEAQGALKYRKWLQSNPERIRALESAAHAPSSHQPGTPTGKLTLEQWRGMTREERNALGDEVNNRMQQEALRRAEAGGQA